MTLIASQFLTATTTSTAPVRPVKASMMLITSSKASQIVLGAASVIGGWTTLTELGWTSLTEIGWTTLTETGSNGAAYRISASQLARTP